MTMHAGHSSPNGLGLADSLAQHNRQWPRSPGSLLETQDSAASPGETDMEGSQSDVDQTPSPSATQTQDDPADLYKQLFEMDKKVELSRTASKIFESSDDSPVEDDDQDEASTGPVDPEADHSIQVISSPVAHTPPLGSPHLPVSSSPVEIAPPIIQETPHDLVAPQELTIWARDEGLWCPAYCLQKNNDQLVVKFPGQENATTVFGYDTRELVLEIGTMVRTSQFDGEYPITDLIRDSHYAYCTTDNFSCVEILVEATTHLVPIEHLYIQDTVVTQSRPPKRQKLASAVFDGTVFGISDLGDTGPEIESLITTHGGTVVDPGHLVNTDADWMGTSEYVFGAIIGMPESQSPEILQGKAMGWPCVSVEYVQESIRLNKLLDPGRYTIIQVDRKYPEMSLEQQFYCRTVTLGAVLPPVYWLGAEDSPTGVLLATASAKPVRVISSLDQASPGSVVVTGDDAEVEMSISTQQQLSRKQRLRETICMAEEWLFKCVLNGSLV